MKKDIIKIIEDNIDMLRESKKVTAEEILNHYLQMAERYQNKFDFIETFDASSFIKQEIYNDINTSDNYHIEKTALERFKFLNKEDIIGKGSDRVVYRYGDLAIKVAKNKRGIFQNKEESSIYDIYGAEYEFIPKVHEIGDDYLVMELGTPYSKLKDIYRKDLNEFTRPLQSVSIMDYNSKSNKYCDAMHKMGFGDLADNQFLFDDFKSRRNWGMNYFGSPILLDSASFSSKDFVNIPRDSIRKANTKKIEKLSEKLGMMIFNIYKHSIDLESNIDKNSNKHLFSMGKKDIVRFFDRIERYANIGIHEKIPEY